MLVICLFFVLGCGPTYKASDFENSIKRLCNDQYKKDVRIEIVGDTARIYADFDNLFDEKTLGISKDAADKIDDILLAIHRVTLSTDKLLNFYVFVASSSKIRGVQVVLVRYIEDAKRLMLGDISRGEYFDRMILEANINTRLIAEERVKELFQDLANYKGVNEILREYFIKDADAKDLSVEFLTLISERWLKSYINYEFLDMRSKKESTGRVLVHCKVKEVYMAKNPYDAAKPVYPPGFVSEYIIAVFVSGINTAIEKVIPLTRIVDGELVNIEPPKAYKDYESWRDEDKFAGEVKITDFLAEQLARRIKAKLSQNRPVALNYDIKDVKGDYAEGAFAFSLDLQKKTRKGEELKDEKIPDEKYLADLAFKLIAEVLRRYEFNDYESITVIDGATGGNYISTKAELIKYR